MPFRRRVATALALALGAALLAPVAPATAAPATAPAPVSSSATLRARVAALQAQVDAVGAQLEAGSRAWEAGQHRLGVLTQQEFAVSAQLDGQRASTRRSQSGVDALVRAAYTGGGLPPTLGALLDGDLQALADLDRVRAAVERSDASVQAGLAALTTQREATERLLARRAELRRQALAERQATAARQVALAAQATALSTTLATTAADLEAALAREAEAARQQAAARAAAAAAAASARAAEAARAAAAASGAAVPVGPVVPVSYVPGAVAPATGGACLPATSGGYVNGFLPDAVLCPLPGRPGARLRTDAAQSFVAMDAERTASGLPPLCVTDSYRDYAGQLDVFARKPGLAAIPGRSQHGWGLALDLCGGVERFDGEAHLWMQQHAARYGWVHPAWAEPHGSKPEAWHWEFQG